MMKKNMGFGEDRRRKKRAPNSLETDTETKWLAASSPVRRGRDLTRETTRLAAASQAEVRLKSLGFWVGCGYNEAPTT
jgi:hypothetical protein